MTLIKTVIFMTRKNEILIQCLFSVLFTVLLSLKLPCSGVIGDERLGRAFKRASCLYKTHPMSKTRTYCSYTDEGSNSHSSGVSLLTRSNVELGGFSM